MELLGREIKIKQVLDSESNKESEDDKFNLVDVLVEFANGDLVIVEVQNSKEYDYFHRMLYGTSKVITEHIKEGQPYDGIKECFSNGVNPNQVVNAQSLIYELINMYTREPLFKNCIQAFVDYGLAFEDKILLAVLLDDAISLDKQLTANKNAITQKYTFIPK